MPNDTKRMLLIIAIFAASTCVADEPIRPIPLPSVRPGLRPAPKYVDLQVDSIMDKAARAKLLKLKGRSFNQLHPSIDANPREVLQIHFREQLKVYAQRAADRRATHEWDVSASEATITALDEKGSYKIVLNNPTLRVQFGDKFVCDEFEFHVKLGQGRGETMFRFPQDSKLPAPFPVFGEWTKFREPQIFN